MKIIAILLFIGLAFGGCGTESARSGCQHPVTVVDKTGLDGCTTLLRLENDAFLEPVEWQAEKPELVPGEKYLINYQEVPSATICMAGTTVRITCITSAE